MFTVSRRNDATLMDVQGIAPSDDGDRCVGRSRSRRPSLAALLSVQGPAPLLTCCGGGLLKINDGLFFSLGMSFDSFPKRFSLVASTSLAGAGEAGEGAHAWRAGGCHVLIQDHERPSCA